MGEFEITRRGCEICLALPEVTERPSHKAPAFFVECHFAMLWPAGHHEVVRPLVRSPVRRPRALIASDPERFLRPKYVGSRGWIGTWLDGDCDWAEVAELCVDAYRVIAPVRLTRLLDDPAPS